MHKILIHVHFPQSKGEDSHLVTILSASESGFFNVGSHVTLESKGVIRGYKVHQVIHRLVEKEDEHIIHQWIDVYLESI